MVASTAELLDAIRTFAIGRCAASDPAHDELHLRRVVANANALVSTMHAAAEPIDRFVVEAACWLHDCVQITKGQGRPGEAARRSAEQATAFLRHLDLASDTVAHIDSAIRTHSFSGGLPPESIEGAIVQDADRLDALGAVGIARFWVTMVSMGGTMYHPEDPAASSRPLDDRAWALDHIERKLLRLVDLMNTPAGRSEAVRRTAFLREYHREFLRELGAAEQPR